MGTKTLNAVSFFPKRELLDVSDPMQKRGHAIQQHTHGLPATHQTGMFVVSGHEK
jgi:hypothetical protein